MGGDEFKKREKEIRWEKKKKKKKEENKDRLKMTSCFREVGGIYGFSRSEQNKCEHVRKGKKIKEMYVREKCKGKKCKPLG